MKLTRCSASEPEKYVANWPLMLSDGPVGGFSVEETGAYVLEAFKDPKKWIGISCAKTSSVDRV